eukprot:scaffold186033_cov17-Tisochrysis_lutea.AAC.1
MSGKPLGALLHIGRVSYFQVHNSRYLNPVTAAQKGALCRIGKTNQLKPLSFLHTLPCSCSSSR